MLLGIWENIEHLEEKLSLPELELVITAAREKEKRNNEWLAVVNGIDLNRGQSEDASEKVEEMKRRIEAEKNGVGRDEFEFLDLGLDIEIEE